MNDFDKIVLDFFKNYQDRKMKKWVGFFLSDHTVAITRDEKRRASKHPRKQAMSPEEISVQLLKAYGNHCLVHLQVKVVDGDDQLPADVVGFVNGYSDEGIVVDGHKIALEDINHIEVD
ncbi:hypothetical protein EQ500_06515 [Lactobacillus sp. XV13L]|nr:hypothetical protein [Lactobacillus sp. XV13L]